MAHRSRTTLVLAVLATAAGYTTARMVRERRSRRPAAGHAHPVGRTTRTARSAQMAGVGTRLGGAYAMHRARQVFASADRKEALAREFELRTAAEVTSALGNMKGALMKLGQMASYLDDGLPQPVREALASLQQDAPPMSPALSAEVVERELGLAPRDLFEEWDEVPIAAASIGQVHRAITRDGRPVAVKVQYPGVDEAIRADLDNSDLLFSILGMVFPGLDPGPIIEEVRDRVGEEVDYRAEAENQRLFAAYYEGHPFIAVPHVVDELSTGHVLTTELATGRRMADLAEWTQHERDLAGEAIFRFVFRSLYRIHAFNGDPHPGNYLFRPGGHVTFLDFGLVKRFTPHEVDLFESMVDAIVLRRDAAGYRRIIEDAGVLRRGADMTDAEVVEWFGHFYLPVLDDRVSTFTHEYARDTVQKIFSLQSEVNRFGNVPKEFVILQRINLGLYAVLAELGATANWRRIAEELWPLTDAPPTTALGEAEAGWLASRPR
ncbi:MAG TPA: AarF/ABC1/UbiB kinase family protein [Acidimicrobiales bacterium]|nr:AarF/ABC1/UbiB kinase family protein [Acidimicrobiales bacterium]